MHKEGYAHYFFYALYCIVSYVLCCVEDPDIPTTAILCCTIRCTQDGYSALTVATHFGHAEMVALLLQNGANADLCITVHTHINDEKIPAVTKLA